MHKPDTPGRDSQYNDAIVWREKNKTKLLLNSEHGIHVDMYNASSLNDLAYYTKMVKM